MRILLLLIGNFFIVLFLSMVYAFVPRGKLRQQMERRLAQVRRGQGAGGSRAGWQDGGMAGGRLPQVCKQAAGRMVGWPAGRKG